MRNRLSDLVYSRTLCSGVLCLPAILLMFLTSASATAQLISIGVKGGLPLTDALETPLQPASALQYVQSTHHLVVGPSLEVHLGDHFGIELDALHRGFDYQLVNALTGQSPGMWEFPLVVKFRVLPKPIQPYVEGGVAFSRLTSISDLIELKNRSSKGIVIGGGIEFHLGIVKISPEIRYNNWTDKNFDVANLISKQNQAQFLIGFTF